MWCGRSRLSEFYCLDYRRNVNDLDSRRMAEVKSHRKLLGMYPYKINEEEVGFVLR